MSYTQPGNFSNTGAPMGERSPVGLDSWFNGFTDLHSSPRDVLHLPAAGAPPSPIAWERAGVRVPVAVAYPTVSANMDYTRRRNLNRGYMKLELWHRGMDLFEMAFKLGSHVADFKLRSQFTDAAQSVSANVAEGYGRRTLPEYIQFLYAAKGSLGETLTRACGLRRAKLIPEVDFENFDKLHYEVENKLLALISSLELK